MDVEWEQVCRGTNLPRFKTIQIWKLDKKFSHGTILQICPYSQTFKFKLLRWTGVFQLFRSSPLVEIYLNFAIYCREIGFVRSTYWKSIGITNLWGLRAFAGATVTQSLRTGLRDFEMMMYRWNELAYPRCTHSIQMDMTSGIVYNFSHDDDVLVQSTSA